MNIRTLRETDMETQVAAMAGRMAQKGFRRAYGNGQSPERLSAEVLRRSIEESRLERFTLLPIVVEDADSTFTDEEEAAGLRDMFGTDDPQEIERLLVGVDAPFASEVQMDLNGL